jgi:glycosyltransferase involved in cell wall biosynthesis
MNTDDRQFGRKRTKKAKIVPPAALSTGDSQTPSSASQPPTEKIETQASLDIPVPESIPETPVKPPPRADERARSERAHHKGERFREDAEKRRDRQKPRDRTQRAVPERRQIRVSVIIPAYNEEENVKPLLDQFNEVIQRLGSDWEVLLVDDGSTDKTAERARDASIRYHWLRVVGYAKNRGLTAALETGFKNARGSVYVFYPADLQYHPQDIPRMINRIDRGADIVTGWKQGKYQKRLVSYIYNRLCRALFNLKIHDLNSVKAFRKNVTEKMIFRRDWHRYMIVLAAEAGFIVDEVKVNVYPRHAGKTKFGTGRILGGLLDLLSVKFQISFTKKPLRLFGTWGILSLLCGIVLGLVAIYLRFFTPHGSRTLLYLVILFILSGLMLFSIGFLAEVIVSLREEIEALRARK